MQDELISRQAVLDVFWKLDIELRPSAIDAILNMVNDLPPVNPQEPKTGHWIMSNIPNEKYVCSECGGACWYYDYQADVVKSSFCPNCGCRMVEPQESEEE